MTSPTQADQCPAVNSAIARVAIRLVRSADFSSRSDRTGFSLIESMMAIAITAIAGSALLSSLGSAVSTSHWTTQSAVGQGLARQLMDEIAACPFPDSDSSRSGSPRRADFDDLDDYEGWSSSPPQTRDGAPLGTDGRFIWPESFSFRPWELQADQNYLNNYRREVTVEPVERSINGEWRVVAATADMRRVTVRVLYSDHSDQDRQVARVTQIFARFPTSP